ncbi:MAG: hypothetical protein IH907_10900 [Proteobacteria bacterium]|nr:hypothetical protein [Pseudomonadota bacterium]
MNIGHVFSMFGFLALVGCEISMEARPDPQEFRCVVTEILWPSSVILDVTKKTARQYGMSNKELFTLSNGRISINYHSNDYKSAILLERVQKPNEVSLAVYIESDPDKARQIADELVLKMSGIGVLEVFDGFNCGREFPPGIDESYEAWLAVEDFFN